MAKKRKAKKKVARKTKKRAAPVRRRKATAKRRAGKKGGTEAPQGKVQGAATPGRAIVAASNDRARAGRDANRAAAVAVPVCGAGRLSDRIAGRQGLRRRFVNFGRQSTCRDLLLVSS